MAFTAAFVQFGGSTDLLPFAAAVERYQALIGFMEQEKREGGMASWPARLCRVDEAGGLSVANDLFLAAAVADLKWCRPFDRNRLLALAG